MKRIKLRALSLFVPSNDAFLIAHLNVQTIISASPFDEGWKGAVKWSIPACVQNSMNVDTVKAVSDTNVSGRPFSKKMSLRALIVDSDVILKIFITNGDLEWASTTITHILSQNGPSKSTWILNRALNTVWLFSFTEQCLVQFRKKVYLNYSMGDNRSLLALLHPISHKKNWNR